MVLQHYIKSKLLFFIAYSLSVFEYLYSKLEKMEGILSQVMCEMISSNVAQKSQKTEDELISGIIFKVVGLLPEGTLLDYAKKLSRHVRQAKAVKDAGTLTEYTLG